VNSSEYKSLEKAYTKAIKSLVKAYNNLENLTSHVNPDDLANDDVSWELVKLQVEDEFTMRSLTQLLEGEFHKMHIITMESFAERYENAHDHESLILTCQRVRCIYETELLIECMTADRAQSC
jgi:hypothetical protein